MTSFPFKLTRGRVIDVTPTQFTIPAQTGQLRNTDIRSAQVTPVGYNSPSPVTVSGGLVSINGGADTAGPTTISPGQYFTAVNHSSGSYNTQTVVTVTIGGISADFDVTTEAFVPVGAISMRSNDIRVIDVSNIIALFNDAPYSSDRITVTNNGSSITAQLWLLSALNGVKNVAIGQSWIGVGAEFDNFRVSTLSMVDGDTQTIDFDGIETGTGLPLRATLTIACANDPASQSWSMGAMTLGMFGGFPIHQLLQGNPQHWSKKSETSTDTGLTNRMTVIYDPASRTEGNVGSGLTYPNGYARLVIQGTTTNSIKTQGDNNAGGGSAAFSAPFNVYGGAPLNLPAVGATTTVVLQNSDGLPDRTVVITWVANQMDVAPWPLLDGYAADAGTPTHQPGWTYRRGATHLKFGTTMMWEQGQHFAGAALPGTTWQIGFGVGFAATSIGGTPPTGLFVLGSGRYTAVTDTLVYTEGAAFDPSLITWQGRTPLTWVDMPKGISTTSINNATNTQLGVRMTGFALGSGPGFSAGSSTLKFMIIDHCDCRRNDGLVSTHKTGANIIQGAAYLHNYSYQLEIQGTDAQRWGSLFQGIPYGVPTALLPNSNTLTNSGYDSGSGNYGGVDTITIGAAKLNSSTSVWRAADCFSPMFNMKAADDYGHWDWEQWDNSNAVAGRQAGMRVVGKMMISGTGRLSTGLWPAQPSDTGKMLPGRNEAYFHSPQGSYIGDYQIAGLLSHDYQPNGFFAKFGRLSQVRYSAWYTPAFTPPQGWIPEIGVVNFTPTTPSAENLSTIQIAHNVFSTSASGGTNATYTGNQTQAAPGQSNAAWLNRLNDYTRDSGTLDNIIDVMDMFGFRPGQDDGTGPFASTVLTMIDYRRRVYNPAIFS